jgi:tetraacyldisaccharide 4'-kinase
MHKKRAYIFLESLWEKSKDFSLLFLYEKFIFIFLCFCELFYRAGFNGVLFLKRLSGMRALSFFKIISVGNLSVGGTGKSVFTKYLIESTRQQKGAIVLRGYKRISEKKNQIVSLGQGALCSPKEAGDEASMFAATTNVPVVVGADRYASCLLLQQEKKNIDFVVLDDGYQNQQLKKDCEVLLMDARSPFGNNHCLPAGPLREKDSSRADVVILTHADRVAENKINDFKKKLQEQKGITNVFAGKHTFVGFINCNGEQVPKNILQEKKCCVTAGIGSFSQFVESVKKENIIVSNVKQHPDHYCYTRSDIDGLLNDVSQNKCDAIITTQKDWQKIKPFLTKKELAEKIPLFIFDISFTFLSKEEQELFFCYMHTVLQKN